MGKQKEISITEPEELERLLDTISEEIVSAFNYFTLLTNLTSAIHQHSDAFSYGQTFWSLTTQSLREAAILCVCRVYDTQDSSLNLSRLIITI